MEKIKDINIQDRPREKAIKYGLESLKDEELLALIIGSGTRENSVTEIASYITKTYKTLANFSLENYTGLNSIKGIKKSKTLLLLAIFEFHRRVLKEKSKNSEVIKNAMDVFERYYDISVKTQEIFLLLILNRKNIIIKEVELYKGTYQTVDVSVKEVLYHVLTSQGVAFIIVHNHPSNNPYPSEDDNVVTDELYRKTRELGILMKDHIIITKETYFSFKESSKSSILNNE